MADPDTRHVSFKGIRHSTQDNDATYIITDVTDADPDCVADQFGKARQLRSPTWTTAQHEPRHWLRGVAWTQP